MLKFCLLILLNIVSCAYVHAKVGTVYMTRTDHVLGELDKMNNEELRGWACGGQVGRP